MCGRMRWAVEVTGLAVPSYLPPWCCNQLGWGSTGLNLQLMSPARPDRCMVQWNPVGGRRLPLPPWRPHRQPMGKGQLSMPGGLSVCSVAVAKWVPAYRGGQGGISFIGPTSAGERELQSHTKPFFGCEVLPAPSKGQVHRLLSVRSEHML